MLSQNLSSADGSRPRTRAFLTVVLSRRHLWYRTRTGGSEATIAARRRTESAPSQNCFRDGLRITTSKNSRFTGERICFLRTAKSPLPMLDSVTIDAILPPGMTCVIQHCSALRSLVRRRGPSLGPIRPAIQPCLGRNARFSDHFRVIQTLSDQKIKTKNRNFS